MLGELVEFGVGVAEAGPIDVELAQQGAGKIDRDIRGHRLGVCIGATRGDQQTDVLVLGQPLQRSRDALGGRLHRVRNALQMGGHPVQEVAGRVYRRLHQQGVGAGEIAVHGLAGDAEGAGYVGDREVRAPLVDRLAGRGQDPGNRLFVGRPAPSRPTRAFAWANLRTTGESPRPSTVVGDRQILDPVDPPGPEPLRLGQFGDVGDLVGDLVEHQLDLHPRQVGADAVVRAVAAERQVRVGVAQDVEA